MRGQVSLLRDRLIGLVTVAIGLFIAGSGTFYAVEVLTKLGNRVEAVSADSALLAAPVLGLSIISLGCLMLVGTARPRWATGLFAAFLSGAAATILLAAVGGVLVGATLTSRGYRRCEATMGVRTISSVWVLAGRPCPTQQSDLLIRNDGRLRASNGAAIDLSDRRSAWLDSAT